MGVQENSLLSNAEVEMSFEREFKETGVMHGEYTYKIILFNKTREIIYVDKASSFILDEKNNGVPLYTGTETSSTTGHSIGAGLGLSAISSVLGIGGTAGTIINNLSVTGGYSEFATITHRDLQILAIPPRGKITLVEGLKIPIFYIEEGILRMGETVSFTYEHSPSKWAYFITYSHNKDFVTYSNLHANAYCKYLYGYIGIPIKGGNAVGSNFKTHKEQPYSWFRLKSEQTEYNRVMPNVISGK